MAQNVQKVAKVRSIQVTPFKNLEESEETGKQEPQQQPQKAPNGAEKGKKAGGNKKMAKKSFIDRLFPRSTSIALPRREDSAYLESDSSFHVTKEEAKEARRHCVGRKISVSPETMLMVYDMLFFLTYSIGWLITIIWNNAAIDDNPVVKVFKMYNICIGVDTHPARYFAIPMSYMFTIAFFLTVVLFIKRMLDQRELSKRCSKVWRSALLGIAMLFNLAFGWTIGVMPTNATTLKVHFAGFIIALGGYALLKLISIIEFGYFADTDDGEEGLSCKDMCYTWRKLIFLTFEGLCCGVLTFSSVYLATLYNNSLYSKPEYEIDAILNGTIPDDVKADFYTTTPVLVVTVICPIVAQIINPHRRRITITFKYQHPDVAIAAYGEEDPDFVLSAKDRCLDKPIPCRCCFK